MTQHPAILALGCALPAYRVHQADVGQWMSQSLGHPPTLSRWITRLYERSGIDTRYTCLPDSLHDPAPSRFAPGCPIERVATTAERMAIYEREAVPIGVAAARNALAALAPSAATPDDLAAAAATITHLIAVSCTGFFAPSLDQAIARALGLPATVERTLIGFMGCAAAFNALRLANQIVQAQPNARVLIVCVELCSLHIQPGTRKIDLIVASLFSDGAGACIVGRPDAASNGDHFALRGFHTALTPDTNDFMVWQIGNHGFVLNLAPQIPAQLALAAPAALHTLMGATRPQFWAIHPGGRSIIESLSTAFDLQPSDTEVSRTILREIGNISSATILHVLHTFQQRMRATVTAPQSGVAMAFGPGLVTEMAHLEYVPPSTDS
jgi:predicted naringenin-chalcone synthase